LPATIEASASTIAPVQLFANGRKLLNHPYHEEAKRTMRILLDQDHGDNLPQWESAMNAFLEKAANEANEPTPTPSQ
jgi:hypothetical protein